MKYSYDLHIHTALSPCADNYMTPNNIVNMSILKQLDIIAVTDHNSCENAAAVIEVSKGTNLIVIPGIEVESSEEVHMICLFRNIESALKMQNIIYDNLPNIKNKSEIFGEQILYNSKDEIIGINDRLLITATKLSIDDIIELTNKFDGVSYPAHIDRNSYSILSNLGLIPRDLKINVIEFSKYVYPKNILNEHSYLKKYYPIQSSDAHYLEDIMEAINFIELDKKDIDNIINKFKSVCYN